MATARVVAACTGGFPTAKHHLSKRARYRTLAEGLNTSQQLCLSHLLWVKNTHTESNVNPSFDVFEKKRSKGRDVGGCFSSSIPPLPTASAAKIQPLEHQTELTCIDLHMASTHLRLSGDLERPALEPLIQQ